MPESKTMQTAASVAMFSPDGEVHLIPNEQISSAIKAGGVPAVPMTAPDGNTHWIPTNKVADAQKAGGKVDWSKVPQEHHEGFWGALGKDLFGMVGGAMQLPSQAVFAPGAAVQQAAQIGVDDFNRRMEGRSATYRIAAPIASTLTGVNTRGMEEAAHEGDTAGVVGHAAAPPVAMAATAGAAKLAPVVIRGAGRAALLGKTPEGAYQSALKPSTTLGESKTNAIVQTGLREGIPVSPAGLEKLSTLIDDLNQKIADVIQSDPNRPINKFSVTSRLTDTAKKFQNQVNPNGDLAAISEAGNEFLENQPGAIRAEDAQALKTGTYRQLKGRAYGELKGASVEAQKTLARGLKEELANAFPELTDLNARESQLLQLQPILEKAVARIGNHQIAGIGTPITAAGVKAVTNSNALSGTAAFLKAVVDNPNVKSRLAIALNRQGVPLPTATARIAAYSAALGSASARANTQPPDDQTNQSQPKP